MQWIILLRLIMDIISKLNNKAVPADQDGQEEVVRETVQDAVEEILATPGEVSARFGAWEELVEHIAAIIMFFIRRNTPQV